MQHGAKLPTASVTDLRDFVTRPNKQTTSRPMRPTTAIQTPQPCQQHDALEL